MEKMHSITDYLPPIKSSWVEINLLGLNLSILVDKDDLLFNLKDIIYKKVNEHYFRNSIKREDILSVSLRLKFEDDTRGGSEFSLTIEEIKDNNYEKKIIGAIMEIAKKSMNRVGKRLKAA